MRNIIRMVQIRETWTTMHNPDIYVALASGWRGRLQRAWLRVADWLQFSHEMQTAHPEAVTIDIDDLIDAVSEQFSHMLDRGERPAFILMGQSERHTLYATAELYPERYPQFHKRSQQGGHVLSILGLPVVVNPYMEGVCVVPGTDATRNYVSEARVNEPVYR